MFLLRLFREGFASMAFFSSGLRLSRDSAEVDNYAVGYTDLSAIFDLLTQVMQARRMCMSVVKHGSVCRAQHHKRAPRECGYVLGGAQSVSALNKGILRNRCIGE